MVKGIRAERGVIAAFELSWKKLTGFSPYLAMICSQFAPSEIPWVELIEPTVKQLGWDKQAIIQARKQLANLHLIEIIEQSRINLHPLLREYYQYHSKKLGNNFINQIKKSFIVSCLTIAKTIPYTPVIKDIERVRDVIPHLAYLSQTMLDNIVNLEDDLIWVFLGVALFYQGQGQYQLAEPFLTDCLKEVTARLGKNHPDTASSLNNLALFYETQGKLDKAENYAQRALNIYLTFRTSKK